ncbi:hypothetical protein Droror1_Dr00020180, partial [Drosera rotundifolia]
MICSQGIWDPGRGGLERDVGVRLITLARMEESMLGQKAHIEWLELGDRNTTFFFSSVPSRQNRGGVRSLIGDDGRAIRCREELMGEARGYFGSLLFAAPRVAGLRDDQVLPPIRRIIPPDRASVLAVPVSREEVRAAFFALGRHKASGPDGYNPADGVWSRWVRTYLLRGRSFWSVSVPHRCTWIWRKLLSMRHLVRDLTAWRMGDGSRISLWYDSWLPTGPSLRLLGATPWRGPASRLSVLFVTFTPAQLGWIITVVVRFGSHRSSDASLISFVTWFRVLIFRLRPPRTELSGFHHPE